LEKLDLSDFESIEDFVALIKQKYGKIDVLVNNAGVAAKGDAFDSEVVKFTFQTVNGHIFRISMELLISLKKSCLILVIMVRSSL
jgi:carbonyl reductase 1